MKFETKVQDYHVEIFLKKFSSVDLKISNKKSAHNPA